MSFIKVNDRSGLPMYVNTDRIVSFRRYKDGSVEITFDNSLFANIGGTIDELAEVLNTHLTARQSDCCKD